MTEIKYRPLDKRLQNLKDRYESECNAELNVQTIIDLVVTSPFITNSEHIQGTCIIDQPGYFYLYHELSFNLENVDIDTFTEEVLGLIHRELGVLWELMIVGTEKDPVFVYQSRYKDIKIKFCVKEGEFKTCIVKTVVKTPASSLVTTIPEQTQLVLECL